MAAVASCASSITKLQTLCKTCQKKIQNIAHILYLYSNYLALLQQICITVQCQDAIRTSVNFDGPSLSSSSVPLEKALAESGVSPPQIGAAVQLVQTWWCIHTLSLQHTHTHTKVI